MKVNKTHPLYGLCYVVAEALYHDLGGKATGYTPMQAKYKGVSHWWLRGPHGEVIDLTQGQFLEPFPYEKGRAKGFLTKKPCTRTLKFMGAL